MAGTTVLGAVVNQLNANGNFLALCSQGAYTSEESQEISPSPPACIVMGKTKTRWVSSAQRTERWRVTALCYGPAATTAGAANPAESLADAVEAAIDWQDLGITGALTLGVNRTNRSFAKEAKKSPTGERVYRVRLEWLVVLGVG